MQRGRSGDAHDDFSLRLAWDAGDDDAALASGQAADDDRASRATTRSRRPATPEPVEPADPSEPGRLATALDDVASLRVEVVGLREDISGLRDELRAAIASRLAPARRSPGARAAPKAGGTAAEVAGLADEVAALRDELASLRRRIPLRAEGATELDAAQVRRIADLLADRLLGGAVPRRPSG